VHFSRVMILQTQGLFVKRSMTSFLSRCGRPVSTEDIASCLVVGALRDSSEERALNAGCGGKGGSVANWTRARLRRSNQGRPRPAVGVRKDR
jgi:hypothetical protein